MFTHYGTIKLSESIFGAVLTADEGVGQFERAYDFERKLSISFLRIIYWFIINTPFLIQSSQVRAYLETLLDDKKNILCFPFHVSRASENERERVCFHLNSTWLLCLMMETGCSDSKCANYLGEWCIWNGNRLMATFGVSLENVSMRGNGVCELEVAGELKNTNGER